MCKIKIANQLISLLRKIFKKLYVCSGLEVQYVDVYSRGFSN